MLFVLNVILILFKGEDEDVPTYLRYTGQVRNRHLGKRETAKLIKDLWTEKAIMEHKSVRIPSTHLAQLSYACYTRPAAAIAKFGLPSLETSTRL